jgi:hypothetical protein
MADDAILDQIFGGGRRAAAVRSRSSTRCDAGNIGPAIASAASAPKASTLVVPSDALARMRALELEGCT